MTEGQLLGEVTALAEQLGLLWHHCGRSERCQGPKGFPDLVIVGKGGLIFAELKSEVGRTSAEQDEWLWFLARTSIYYQLIWRPSDLAAGTIREVLEEIV